MHESKKMNLDNVARLGRTCCLSLWDALAESNAALWVVEVDDDDEDEHDDGEDADEVFPVGTMVLRV